MGDNIINRQCLNQNQIKKKRKMLLEIEKEIGQLEFNINHPKIANLKINTLRKLKTLLCTGQLIAPYILTAGITFGGFSYNGATPFIIDDQKKY